MTYLECNRCGKTWGRERGELVAALINVGALLMALAQANVRLDEVATELDHAMADLCAGAVYQKWDAGCLADLAERWRQA